MSGSNVSALRLLREIHQTKHQQVTVPSDDQGTDQNTNCPAVHQKYGTEYHAKLL